MKKIVKKEQIEQIKISVSDVGVGRMSPLTTHLLVSLSVFTSDKYDVVSVLNSLLEEAKILPEDILVYRRNSIKHRNIDYKHDEKYSFEK